MSSLTSSDPIAAAYYAARAAFHQVAAPFGVDGGIRSCADGGGTGVFAGEFRNEAGRPLIRRGLL